MAIQIDKSQDGERFTVFDNDAGRDATEDGGQARSRDVGDGPVTVVGAMFNNTSGNAGFIFLYDALAPVVGTDEPEFVFRVPDGTTRRVNFSDYPLRFRNGLSIAGLLGGMGKYPGTNGNPNDSGGEGALSVHLHCRKGV